MREGLTSGARRDILPQNGNGQAVSAGAAMSAAVPSADDIEMDDDTPNGMS